MSLGISPIPAKKCNYSCVYCQLGRTSSMTNDREEYFKVEDIIAEFEDYQRRGSDFDVVTIVGEGEPTLYLKLGDLIRNISQRTSKPVAVITNGALLYDEKVRHELMEADIVMPSLDAYDVQTFRSINRPHKKIDFEKMIDGLRIFSREFKGHIWMEIMMIKGINDDERSLLKIKALLDTIDYDRVYLNSPVRPPAEKFVQETSKRNIELAESILGGISIQTLMSKGFSSEIEDDYEAILSIIGRHPMNSFEIEGFLKVRGSDDALLILNRLENDESLESIEYKGYKTYRMKY